MPNNNAVLYGNNGYIGNWLCDENGTFSKIPTITLNFSKSFPDLIPGITITWSTVYGEWATAYRVTVYHGSQIIFLETVDGNTEVTSVLSGDIYGYDKIKIEILKWSKPYHRARIQRILLGIEKTYDKKDIMSYSADMFVDPLSASLPKSEIKFDLKNLNGEFSRDNPRGLEKYLLERQQVKVRYGYMIDRSFIEWIPGGIYYLSGWEGPQNGITASFTARDGIEFMTDIYKGPTTGTLYSIAEAAFIQADLPHDSNGFDNWTVDESLKNIDAGFPSTLADTNGGYSDQYDLNQKSIAQVLQYIANAACCALYQDRAGKFHLEPVDYSIVDYSIDRFNSYQNAEIKRTKQLKEMDINKGQFVFTVGKRGETQPLINPVINDEQSKAVAVWAADYLQNRRIMSGKYRADPRLDPLDVVRNETKYYTAAVVITRIQYTYNGAFRGTYEGRNLDSSLSVALHSGEPIAYTGLQFQHIK